MNWVSRAVPFFMLGSTAVFTMQIALPTPDTALVQALLNDCANITEFELNTDCPNHREMDLEYKAIALAEVLRTNSTLTKLHLGSCKIGNAGALALAKALELNSTVTHLNLCYNEIGKDGARALGAMLHSNKTISSIYIGNNPLGFEGANAIFNALARSSSLQTLVLFRIKDINLTLLNEALSNNCSLRHLYLSVQFLSSQDTLGLFNSLAKNTQLEALDISHNKMDDTSIRHLMAFISSSHTIRKIRIFNGGFNDQQQAELTKALESNFSLVEIDSGCLVDPLFALRQDLQKRNLNFQNLLPKMMIFMAGHSSLKSHFSCLPRELIVLLIDIFFSVASE